ncbi:hypothetical protein [Solicola sp. PLA-1-18]|uniref:hypothetical protein n=1 Tax=Solicola sp. PLA-1-18 TaxID=3380532 RepID=UPI003B7BE290
MAEDVVDEVQGATVMTLTSAARAAEVLLRSSQDRAVRQAHQDRQASDEACRRYDAQASVAEEFYRQAADPEFVRLQTQDVVVNAWRGAQEWKDLEPQRFGPHADQITQNVWTEYGIDLDDVAARLGDRDLAAELGEMRVQRTRGVDEDLDRDDDANAQAVPGVADGMEYDTDAARRAREEQLDRSDLPAETRNAMKVADHLNGTNPALAAGTHVREGKTKPAPRAGARIKASDLGR